MLFKIYLFISILNLVFYFLTCLSMALKLKDKKDKLRIERNFASSIISWLRMIIVSFIPVFHVIYLFIYLFNYEELKKRVEMELEKRIKENAIKE